MLILAGGAVALYLVVLTALFISQRRIIYAAPRDQIGVSPAGLSLVKLKTADDLILHAAFRPSTDGRPTLVFFHGNGDGLAGADVATRFLGQAGYGLLLVEYRGYGGNSGDPSEAGLYRDGRAALDWLASRGITGRQIILVGNSLGSGIATQLATERTVGGLVLISPFASLADAVGPHVWYAPVRLLLRDRYDNLAKLRGRNLALLVLHGRADTLISASQGTEIAKAVHGSRLILVPGVGHELAYLPSTQREIGSWLAQLSQ